MNRDDLPDELDELLDGRRADLEARFQELEQDAEIERMRRESGAPPRPAPRPDPGASPRGSGGATGESPAGRSATEGSPGTDPLSDMKDALDSDKELERYLLVLCQGCGTRNRMSLTRVRTARPICGRCKQDLSFPKL